MFVLMKILHMLALLGGGAASIAPGLLLRALSKTGHSGAPPAHAVMTFRILGIIGLFSILLLWISGIYMLSGGYDGADMSIWFALKLVAAATILGISAFLNLAAARAARGGTPLDPGLVRSMQSVVRGALLIAVILGVFVFS